MDDATTKSPTVPAPPILCRHGDSTEWTVANDGVLMGLDSGFTLRDEDLDVYFEAGITRVEFETPDGIYRFKVNQ